MSDRTRATKGTTKPRTGFTEEERAAMKEAVRERRARPRSGAENGERDVLEKIAAMQPSDRALAQGLHAIVKAVAPNLVPRTWYGMPAYAKEDDIVCFFQPAQKFKTRYATLGFSDSANLDESSMWPTAFALTDLSAVNAARITALVKRAVG